MIYKLFSIALIFSFFGTSKSNIPSSFDYFPTSTTNKIIKHDFYALSYNEKYEQAEWVTYYLKSHDGTTNHFKRPRFMSDPKVSSESAHLDNYKKSGFDRGHLCAAADMRFSKEAFDDTFYTSNISPQKHSFNDGVWKRLEDKTRYWSQKYNGIYVVTGGVLQKDLKTIGQENVAVPNYFYKILFCNLNGTCKMVGFLVPHKKSDAALYTFVVSVDSIEKMTGIDFFPQLEDRIENNLEQKSDYKVWSFN
ncbi:DNA/RNA non-specific endonuclease [Flavobacterium psychrotolerans]|uniref:Endonuclease n=1 Tax=Flavobacterium psychrotolerans TaxID=2169410 RepID=A0A2U1JG42_9FLAO|nr:DNA/RNA non-specific endonuclease [Flavobacterium psychrotolerans]PWA04112.1 endonuclease [Flavobacterium psychrotolerans]